MKVKSKWATPTLEAELFNLVNNVPLSVLGVLCAFARVIVYPIFSSLRQVCPEKSRRDANKYISLWLRTWRALPRGIPTRPRSSCSPEALFHRGSHRLSDLHLISELGALCAFARGLVYPIFSSSRQDAKTAKKYISLWLRTWRPLRLCESDLFPDSVNPNSTANFIYVWLALGTGL